MPYQSVRDGAQFLGPTGLDVPILHEEVQLFSLSEEGQCLIVCSSVM